MVKKLLTILIFSSFISSNIHAAESHEEQILRTNDPAEVKECFEKVNRFTFAVNKKLDDIIFEPLAKGYRVLPNPIRNGVSNSLSNLSNLVTIPNNLLQGDFKVAGLNTGRFAINTTLGILGFIDVAEKLGMPEYQKEDWGQTLAVKDVGPGCYIVLPVLGPSTVRDASASLINFVGGNAWYNVTVRNETEYFNDNDYLASRLGAGLDFRAKNIDSFDNLEENAIDFYASVKSLYLQDRLQKILNSNEVIESMDDSDWDEIAE